MQIKLFAARLISISALTFLVYFFIISPIMGIQNGPWAAFTFFGLLIAAIALGVAQTSPRINRLELTKSSVLSIIVGILLPGLVLAGLLVALVILN